MMGALSVLLSCFFPEALSLSDRHRHSPVNRIYTMRNGSICMTQIKAHWIEAFKHRMKRQARQRMAMDGGCVESPRPSEHRCGELLAVIFLDMACPTQHKDIC